MGNIISIKHGGTEFATMDENKSIILNCSGKIINDNIGVEITLEEWDGSIIAGDKPTNLTPSATYTGSVITNGYITPSGVTMVGNNSGTGVDTYTATYTPNSGYIWSDGTSSSVSVVLTINKLSLTKPSLTQTSFTYTGSTITPDWNNFNSTYENKSGTTTASAVGSYTAYGNLNNTSNTQWSDSTTSAVSLPWSIVIPSLNDASWSYINSAGSSASSYWSVGDTKTGTYINNEKHTYRIVEFNHSGDSGNITFEQVKLMANYYYFENDSSYISSSSSWANTSLKSTINGFSLSSDLSSAIKEASKPCATSVSDGTQTSVSSNLWLMSEKEIAGTTTKSICTTEGTEYAYYVNAGSTESSRVKWPRAYWLRSAMEWTGSNARFVYITGGGIVWGDNADLNPQGVAPCFCI